jgi:hypothetical protein
MTEPHKEAVVLLTEERAGPTQISSCPCTCTVLLVILRLGLPERLEMVRMVWWEPFATRPTTGKTVVY